MTSDDPLVDNAASAKQVRAARKKERLSDRQRKSHWKRTSSDASGIEVLWEILGYCGLFEGGFSGERAHYREGKRDVGSFIMNRMNDGNPDAFREMMLSRANQTE